MDTTAIAVFSGLPRLTPEVADRARSLFSLPHAEVFFFSRHSNNYALPLRAEDIGALYSSLPKDRFNGVMVDTTCELFSGRMSIDWISHLVEALVEEGIVALPNVAGGQADLAGRADPSEVLTALGLRPEIERSWVLARRGSDWIKPTVSSVLGAFLCRRGEFIMNSVFGGTVRHAETTRLNWLIGADTIANPSQQRDLSRYDRDDLIRIVELCRSDGSSLDEGLSTVKRKTIEASSFTLGVSRLEANIRSWQNYLMYGTAYKAATIASVLRREFGTQPIRFLEHGGYTGLLSMQLLMDVPSVEQAWCCEVDPEVLLNTQLLLESLPSSVAERFHFSIGPVEEHAYSLPFDVIAFVHMLLYVRRDELPVVLSRTRDALRSGGVLLILENTKPPTTSGGTDDALIFLPDELDSYLSAIGEIEYLALKSGAPLTREEADGASVLRLVRASR